MPFAGGLRDLRVKKKMTIDLPKLDPDFIPYGRHVIDSDDCDAVLAALNSANLTQGKAVDLFERQLNAICGSLHACAVANGTAALHLAVKSLNPAPGSYAITTPITFAATSNALLYNGLTPIFTEVEESTGLMSMDSCESILKDLASRNKKVSVVVPVHFSGAVCDMERLWDLSATWGFKVVEDASHALGACYAGGDPVGSDNRSAFTTISFHPVKHIATGEGGVILSNNSQLQDSVMQLRSHGILRDPARFVNRDEAFDKKTGEINPWYYEMQDLGFNYRMPDINAALGYSQTMKFDRFLTRRHEIARSYDEAFKNNPLLLPLKPGTGGASAYHLYVVLLKDETLWKQKAGLMNLLKSRGIGTQVHYIPVPLLPYYAQLGYTVPASAMRFYRKCLSIPMYSGMSDQQVQKVVYELNRCMNEILADTPANGSPRA